MSDSAANMDNQSVGGDQYSADRLPPRPDSQTGEPFPPHGLSYLRAKDNKPEDNPGREIRLSYRPDPPDDRGPVLAWHRESRRGKLSMILTAFILMLLIVAAISLFHGDGLAAFSYWQMWAVVVVGTVLTSSPFSYLTYAAGADWVMVERSRWGIKKRAWTDLYNLKKVDVSYGGTTFHLWLWGSNGGFSRSFEELQSNRRIWDLVYNGILHSVANGAQASMQAIGVLQLNKLPFLQFYKAEQADNDRGDNVENLENP